MGFSFLNPWFWLGAAAIAVPLWLHLRRRVPRDLVRFSAVRFLEDQPVAKRDPWRLRDLLLLAARLLALLLLVGALAWPYRRDAAPSVIRESRVYVLDNTLSHRANDGFRRAVDRLRREFAEAGGDLQLAVVELAAQPRVLVAFGDDRATAGARLDALQPSFQRGSYLAAFRLAESLFANSLGDRRRIVWLGDNQENQWTEHLTTPPFLPADVAVELPEPRTTNAPNLSVSDPRVQRLFLGDRSLATLSFKVRRNGPADAARIVVRVNGQPVFDRQATFDESFETGVVQAQWEADPAEWQLGEATVEGMPDALDADNRVVFGLEPVREGNVAVLARSPFLRAALSREVMRGQWSARFLDAGEADPDGGAAPESEVLVIESNYLQGTAARKLVWRYLTNGRGVFLVVNHLTPAVNGALRELGFEVGGASGDSKPGKLAYFYPYHPVFHPFTSGDYGNLLGLPVQRHVRLRARQAVPLAFSESGDGLLFEDAAHAGRLFVLAFGLDREHSSWPAHPTFVPFLDLVLQNARGRSEATDPLEPGEAASLAVAYAGEVQELILRDGTNVVVRSPVVQGRAQFKVPDQPGLYTVGYDQEPEPRQMIRVNPSPRESELNYVKEPQAVAGWRLPEARRPAMGSPEELEPRQLVLASAWRQEYWWWCLVAALALLAMETVLAGRRRRST